MKGIELDFGDDLFVTRPKKIYSRKEKDKNHLENKSIIKN